ncbi:expressed unknown protein [Seminavis robusta]|uniref:RING-type domain-containing protein n=1 Tax=Seminavis robusta TaxID=568900 RepID=A0A9N8HJ74_9STRA|nr:expressed unknown protein [Seminavis robusta]|eukprot:Sro538_g162550.1 n/a (206) ;mRNA; f:19372-19989
MSSSSASFDDGATILHLHDPEEHELPSIKFDMSIFVGVMVCVVIASSMIVAFLLYISKMQEKAARKHKEGKKRQSFEDLKSNLECKPWGSDKDETEHTMDMSSAESDESSSSIESVIEEEGDEEMQLQTIAMNGDDDLDSSQQSKHQKDGSCCPICNEIYQFGQPVYESNNPHCGHQAHKVCMGKWLECQNSCPICIQPFVLRTV